MAGTSTWLGAGFVMPLVATGSPVRLAVAVLDSAVVTVVAGWAWVRALRAAAAR